MTDDDFTNDTEDTEIYDHGIYRTDDTLRQESLLVIGAFFAVFGIVSFIFIFALGLAEFFQRLF